MRPLTAQILSRGTSLLVQAVESVLRTLMMREPMLSVSRQGQSRLRQDTIEAGIVPKIIPHGIQFQIAMVQTKRQLHQFASFVESAITLSRLGQPLRER